MLDSKISLWFWRVAFVFCVLPELTVFGEASEPAELAMQAVLDAGGKFVRRDDKRVETVQPFLNGTVLIGIDLHRCTLSEDLLKQLKHLPSVERLYLSGTNITDRNLEHLAALPHLKRLALWRTGLTDQCCRQFAKMKSLEALDIQETKLTEASMQTFAQLPELNRLRYSFRLSTESLRQFLSIAKLEPQKSLRLENVVDTDLHLAGEAFASALETLDLQNSEVSASGLNLFRDSPIESLYFEHCKIRAEDLYVLPWQNIRYCNLRNTPIQTIELIRLFERDDLSLYVTPRLQNIHASLKSPDGVDEHNPAEPIIQIFGTLDTFPPEDFARIKNLRSLTVSGSKSHLYLSHISDPTDLKYLQIGITEGFIALEKFSSLIDLKIHGENFALEKLQSLEHLQALYIDRPLINDDLQHLGSLQNLKSLRLISHNLEGEGLRHLVNLKKLSSLSISSRNLTDTAMPHLAKMTSLVSFTAQGSKITDDGLKHLHGMPHLRDCSMLYSKVTKFGLKKLRESLSQPRAIY